MMSLQTMAFAMVSLVSILMSIMPSANGLLRVVSDASSSAKTLSQIPSHDLYARENIIKSLRAILVSARFVPAKSCELADVLAPPTTNSAAVDAINATMLFVHWPDAVKAGCYTFNQVILQRDQTKAAFDNAKLPAMGGFCFSAPSVAKGASNAFGGPYDPMGPLKQNYTDFYTVVPFEVADSLRTMSNGTIPLIVDALQESGPWNDMLNSNSYTAMKTVFVVLTVVCLCIAAYQITPFFGATGMRYSMRAVVYFTGLVVLLSSFVLNPFSHLSVAQAVCNALVWILSFAAYSWLIITWGQLVYKLRPRRYRFYLRWIYGLFMADILVCIILFAVYASSSSPMLFSVVRPAVIFNIPPVFLASACILFYFGIVFFNSYRTLHHQTTARTTMVKFAILAFFATFSFIMVATTIIYFHLAPVNSSIFAYKTFCILYEVTMYALFGPVFFALATSEMPEINLPRIFNSNTNFYLRTPPLRDDLERSNSRKSVRFIVASPTTPSREYFDSVGSNYSSMHTITIEPSSTVMSGELPSQPSRSRRSSRHTCHPRNSMASSFSQKSTPPSPLTPVRFPPFAHKEEE